MKLQSAMEYLITYGWAILILGVTLVALYALGVFNTNAFTPNICAFPASFGCLSSYLYANGVISINLQQSTASSINVTAIGCNTQGTLYGYNALTPNTIIPIGGNYTYQMSCYSSSNTVIFNGNIGAIYSGYVIVNYTDTQTGFTHVVLGRLVQKVI